MASANSRILEDIFYPSGTEADQLKHELNSKVFNCDHVNAISQMLWPPRDGPLSEPLDLARAADVIPLRRVTWLKWIAQQLVENAQKLFAMTL